IGGAEYFLFGGYEDNHLRGEPGAIIARRDGAICRATVDGAVWIPQLHRRPAPGGPATCKLPATLALRGSLAGVPLVPAPLTRPFGRRTYQEISYRENGGVGYLEFSFPGGAMSTGQCRRLLARPGTPGAGDRARRPQGLLRQWDPSERDRDRRRPGGRVVAQHQRHR